MFVRAVRFYTYAACVYLAAIATAGAVDTRAPFEHLLFIGVHGNTVQFNTDFRVAQRVKRLKVPSVGRAGILTSAISPDHSRVFLGYQGNVSPLAVLDASSAKLLDIPQVMFPKLKYPYRSYYPGQLVAVSCNRVYIMDETFFLQTPPFDTVMVDLDKKSISKRTISKKKHSSYYHQSNCAVSPSGEYMLFADAYQIQFVDLKSDKPIWVMDHGKKRHEVWSLNVDWRSKTAELIWVSQQRPERKCERVKIDLMTRKRESVPTENPWTVVNYGKNTFLGNFAKAYAESGQGRGLGELPIIDDKLRALKDKLTPETIGLFPDTLAQVYISPNARYVLTNKYLRYDYEHFPDGWTLVDMDKGERVKTELTAGLQGFGESLVGIYFTK